MLKKTIQFTALTISLGIFSNLSELQSLPEKFCNAVNKTCDEEVFTTAWLPGQVERADKFCRDTLDTCIKFDSVKK